MRPIQKVYLSGLGAIGSAYAARLYDMDPECIHVVAGPERIARYAGNGVAVNDKTYFFNYIQAGEETVPADLILIAVKQHHLGQVIRDIRKYVGENTIILSFLNGISSEEIIGREYGMDKMLYSYCVGIDAVREDAQVRYSKIGKVVFGEKTNTSYSAKVAAVQELFDRAQIPYSIPEDMIRELWWKFMLNVGVNQTSAVLKATYGVFRQVQEARELAAMASREVLCLAEKAGIRLTEEDIAGYLGIINTLSPEGKTSMLQDVEAGRKTEVEIFAGTVMELGQKYGVPTPVNELLFKMIRALEQMYPL